MAFNEMKKVDSSSDCRTMDVIFCGPRRDLREFIAYLCIDFLLFIVRLVDKLCGSKENRRSESVTKIDKKDKGTDQQSKLQMLDKTKPKSELTGTNRANTETLLIGESQNGVKDSVLGETAKKGQRFSDRITSFNSDTLDEVNSSISESTNDFRRQISALSDYYSSEEDISKEWNSALKEKSITYSLEVARDLEDGLIDPENVSSAYDAICRGVDELKHVSERMKESWNEIKSESGKNWKFAPSNLHQRKSSHWNQSSANDSLGSSGLSTSSKVLISSEVMSSSAAGMSATEGTDDVLQKLKLNERMNRECENTRKLQIYLEKKRLELLSKVTDKELEDLKGGCEVLFAEQTELQEECKTLSDSLTDRQNDVMKGIDVLKNATGKLQSLLCSESERLKIWDEQRTPKCRKIEANAAELRRRFEAERLKFSDADFKSQIAKVNELQQQHLLIYQKYIAEWNELSQQADDVLGRNYLDPLSHEERHCKWKDFSAVDEFQYKIESHLKSYRKYVPQICEIHEQRSRWAVGIFGSSVAISEFEKFYRRYEQKIKAAEEDLVKLQKLQKKCSQGIETYSQLYEKMLNMKGQRSQHDARRRNAETKMEQMSIKLGDHKEYMTGHFIAKRGNECLKEKRENYQVISIIQQKLVEYFQIVFHHECSFADFQQIINELLATRVLQEHLDKCKSFRVDWEHRKQYDKIYSIVHQIENFELVESPKDLEFDAHEERVSTLEKRLPVMVQLHDENCAQCLEIWLANLTDYESRAQEPIAFDDLKQVYLSYKTYSAEVSSHLVALEKNFRTVVDQNLSKIDKNLLQLSLQGFKADESELNQSPDGKLEEYFRQVKKALENFDASLASFDAVYVPYSEFQNELRHLKESSKDEEHDSARLREKLRECTALLRGHRDLLERRRIREKTDRLRAYVHGVLLVRKNDNEQQYGKLFDKQRALDDEYIALSRCRLSEISEIGRCIPRKDLEVLTKNLLDCEQELCLAEKQISSCCQQKLAVEENLIHKYWSLVQNLPQFLNDSEQVFKDTDGLLDSADNNLPRYETFVRGYRSETKCYEEELDASKEIYGLFFAEFSNARHEADELSALLNKYGSLYVTDQSGSDFKTKVAVELDALWLDLKTCEGALNGVGDGNLEIEGRISRLLTDDGENLDGIENTTAAVASELRELRGVQATCRSCKDDLGTSLERRTKEADEIKRRLQDENYDKHCRVDEHNPIENERSFTCLLCSVEIAPLCGIILRECLHEFCKRCMVKYIKDLTTAEAKCPHPNSCCGLILDKEILSLDEEIYKDHTGRSLSEYGNRCRDVVLCWNVKCQKVVGFNDLAPHCDIGERVCPHCDMRNCKRCKVVHEGKESCEAYQMSLPYRKIAESIKCQICCDKDIGIAFVKCGHTCCQDCVKNLVKPGQSFACPFCNSRVASYITLYLPFDK